MASKFFGYIKQKLASDIHRRMEILEKELYNITLQQDEEEEFEKKLQRKLETHALKAKIITLRDLEYYITDLQIRDFK